MRLKDIDKLHPCRCGKGHQCISVHCLGDPATSTAWGLTCTGCGRKTWSKHPTYEDAAKQWDKNIEEDEEL